VSSGVFAVSLIFGAALLALWVDARFPRRELTFYRIIGHAIAAVVIIHLIPGTGSPAAGVVIVFALVLPAVVYMLLSALWLIRLTQTMLSTYR
jgi:hypothetical protein